MSDAPAVELHDVFCLRPAPDGAVVALRGLTLDVAAGERVVVHGPNGAGKSTLLRVLAGELPVDAGSAAVAGTDLAGAPAATLRRLRRERIGIVDQRVQRTLRAELDVLGNVALQLRLSGAADAADRARAALRRLGLAGLERRTVATLSAGEAQQVAVAAATAHAPTVVLADEPSGQLDPRTADLIYDLLRDVTGGDSAALVLVSHDERAARVADRVLRIRDGRLSEEWEPAGAIERLVVDDRGWVRLPEAERRAVGGTARVVLGREPGRLVLSGTDPAPAPVAARSARSRPPATEPIATLSRVSLRLGDRDVLCDVDLVVTSGRVMVVQGTSGTGKTTLLRVLTGLARPDAGTVRLGSVDLAQLERAARADVRRNHVAIVEQDGALAEHLDVLANLDLARAVRGLPPDPAHAAAVADELGLTALAGRPAGLLSGGERQRLAVARALVVDRDLMVLDEPTAHLDEAHAEALAGVLARRARNGVAVVCATHDPVLATAADVRLVASGPDQPPGRWWPR